MNVYKIHRGAAWAAAKDWTQLGHSLSRLYRDKIIGDAHEEALMLGAFRECSDLLTDAAEERGIDPTPILLVRSNLYATDEQWDAAQAVIDRTLRKCRSEQPERWLQTLLGLLAERLPGLATYDDVTRLGWELLPELNDAASDVGFVRPPLQWFVGESVKGYESAAGLVGFEPRRDGEPQKAFVMFLRAIPNADESGSRQPTQGRDLDDDDRRNIAALVDRWREACPVPDDPNSGSTPAPAGVTRATAAAALGVDESTVHRRIKKGKLIETTDGKVDPLSVVNAMAERNSKPIREKGDGSESCRCDSCGWQGRIAMDGKCVCPKCSSSRVSIAK